jgi:hypothetical protein
MIERKLKVVLGNMEEIEKAGMQREVIACCRKARVTCNTTNDPDGKCTALRSKLK